MLNCKKLNDFCEICGGNSVLVLNCKKLKDICEICEHQHLCEDGFTELTEQRRYMDFMEMKRYAH